MKRFYDTVTVEPAGAGFAVALDGRRIKTPSRLDLVVPTEAVAELVAAEWRAQGDIVIPTAMQAARLANTALDRISPSPQVAIDEMLAYADTDLTCIRSEYPEALVSLEAKAFDPYIAFFEAQTGAHPLVQTSLLPEAQHKTVHTAAAAWLGVCSAFELSALHALTCGLGSIFITYGLAHDLTGFEKAWTDSQVGEDFQAKQWGQDQEAEQKAAALKAELEHAHAFYKALSL